MYFMKIDYYTDLSLYRHLHRDRKVLQEFFSVFYLLLETVKITIYIATILFNSM